MDVVSLLWAVTDSSINKARFRVDSYIKLANWGRQGVHSKISSADKLNWWKRQAHRAYPAHTVCRSQYQHAAARLSRHIAGRRPDSLARNASKKFFSLLFFWGPPQLK
jgi:hypothetical protein